MLIKIGQFEFSECWDGVFYKKLSNYPHITDWEIQTIYDFIGYERLHGRACEIEAEDEIVNKIKNYRETYEINSRVPPPKKIEECTACPKYKGCMTDLVCHTSSLENAIKILDSGSLLSPVKARNINSDDMLIFDSDVSKEYLCLYQSGCLTAEELNDIRLSGLE